MKISVIIPIYNAESTIRRTLDSIQKQTLRDFEVLMIDDGSKDESGIICDEYAKSDTRFKVIHKKNEGVAMARKAGVEHAKGEYSIHADADDWAEPTMLEELYHKAKIEDADMVIADYYVNNDKGQSLSKQQPTSLCPNNVLMDIFNGQLFGALWNKLIRTDLYKKCDARFFKGINYCEDVLICAQIMKNVDIKIVYLNKAFYHYSCSVGNNSITGNYNMTFFDMSCKVIDRMAEILPPTLKDEAMKKIKISVKCGAFEHPIFTCRQYYNIYPEVNKYIWTECNTSFVNKLLIYLSYHGFYYIATRLYKVKNHITHHKIR